MDANGQISPELVAQIYDTALDPTQWPILLERIASTLPPIEAEQMVSATRQVNQRISMQEVERYRSLSQISTIVEHLERSAAISNRIKDNDEQEHLQLSLFDFLPLPAFVCAPNGQILQQNRLASELLKTTALVMIDNQRIKFHHNSQQRQFDKLISQLTEPNGQVRETTMRLRDSFQTNPVSISLSRIDDQYQLGSNILVLFANQNVDTKPNLSAFSRQYELTKAEQKLVENLAHNKTLNEISESHGVSINTIRTQLKSVFQKTGCHRQSELMKLVLVNSTSEVCDNNGQLKSKFIFDSARYHHVCEVSNGRQLGFSDIGRTSGVPVIVLPPSTGSRLQQHPDNKVLFDHNIRLITIDRPGFGLSSADPNRTLTSIAYDVEALADNLNIGRFSLIGFCGGGPFALATASVLKERIVHTSLVSSVTPFQPINLFHGVKSSNKFLAQIAMRAPTVLHPLLKIITNNLMKDHELYFDQVYQHLCESDAAALSETEVTDNFLLAFREAMRQGPIAFSEDLVILSRLWNINFENIVSPVTIWHGSLDQHVPVQLARKFHRLIEHSKFNEIDNLGHLLVYHRWSEILQSISAEQS
ncbi:alpha/beta fold hydrolase [Vibrio algarum]|uniref:Alpha/beta fold hydrolase n=1 Tax=Vibrio algarum TaxID=3020714 RepID=A0ABT4YNT2_9VIBR|nr:alpha/beta fold hydrolase [Vibrio sp. KJ40-1]MDB1123207.1 alpha/beta fold hydrolase [Vibrio sp. KJ40-1]